jgi:hypothetical protein
MEASLPAPPHCRFKTIIAVNFVNGGFEGMKSALFFKLQVRNGGGGAVIGGDAALAPIFNGAVLRFMPASNGYAVAADPNSPYERSTRQGVQLDGRPGCGTLSGGSIRS